MKVILVELCLLYIFIKLKGNLEILFICYIKTNKLYFSKQCTKTAVKYKSKATYTSTEIEMRN